MDWITKLSILGSVASLIGLLLGGIAIYQARKAAKEAKASKEASQQAQIEIERFRKELKLISNVVDFGKALALMDDIKSFIIHENFRPVPDKIASLIALLNTIRSPSMELGLEAERKIQGSVVALRKIEDAISRSLLEQDKPKGLVNFNRNISGQIDLLHPLLIDLRNRIGERHD